MAIQSIPDETQIVVGPKRVPRRPPASVHRMARPASPFPTRRQAVSSPSRGSAPSPAAPEQGEADDALPAFLDYRDVVGGAPKRRRDAAADSDASDDVHSREAGGLARSHSDSRIFARWRRTGARRDERSVSLAQGVARNLFPSDVSPSAASGADAEAWETVRSSARGQKDAPCAAAKTEDMDQPCVEVESQESWQQPDGGAMDASAERIDGAGPVRSAPTVVPGGSRLYADPVSDAEDVEMEDHG
ncbi:hypothetical protein DFJ74DRAFT_676960 [Hyaloraphidium curvatum]|nr:hypothetical protein DFJ74DRAFT_676960 [Hyaloraphidium curvatum]